MMEETYSTNEVPNYIVKFEGNINNTVPEKVKANTYNYFAQNDISIGGIQIYEGSVYVSFYSSSSNSALVNSLATSGLTVDPNLSFSYVSIDGSIITCNNCTITSTQTVTQQTVRAIFIYYIISYLTKRKY